MDNLIVKGSITGIFFLLILLSGYWLSHSGKPYSSLVFTLHKLIGLAAGGFLIVTVVRANQAEPLQPQAVIMITITVLIFLLLVAAGGLISVIAEGGLPNLQPAVQTSITWIHKLFPYLAGLSTAISLYLLYKIS